MTRELTQHQKILSLMCRRKDKDWFFPYDFMDLDLGAQYFVGYEASARLSELASAYPDMIDSKRDGKYITRRLKLETIERWFGDLPSDLRYIFHRAGLTAPLKKSDKVIEHSQPADDKTIEVQATYRGNRYRKLGVGTTYGLLLTRLEMGKPVVVVSPENITYADINAFRKEWKVVAQ